METSAYFKYLFYDATTILISTTVSAPLERSRLLLQIQFVSKQFKDKPFYNNVFHCMKLASSEQGVRCLWRGNMLNLIRKVPTKTGFFALKDSLKQMIRHKDHTFEHNHWMTCYTHNLLTGGIAGMTVNSIVYPFDLIRTRIMSDIGTKEKPREFDNARHCVSTLYKGEGIRSMYRGYLPSLQGAFINRALCFGFYDTFTDLNGLNEDTPIIVSYLCAYVSIVTGIVFSYPFDTVTRRIMMESGLPLVEKKFKTTSECWKILYTVKGYKAFYEGFFANVLRGASGAFVIVMNDMLVQRYFKEMKKK